MHDLGGSHMLALSVVKEICRLLEEENLSQRKIAKKLGVSRGTVSALATGRRGVHGREPNEEADEPVGPPARCGSCGMLVVMPCVYCRAVEYRDRLNSERRAA
ncbi:MAG: helix-turn-helix domain-containing protein [Planctomycetota bacterium]